MPSDRAVAPSICVLVAALMLLVATAPRACAHVAEIQVYDGHIVEPEIFNLTLHTNYTPAGHSARNHPEGFSTDDAFTLGPEFAYGVTEWLELGALIPIATEAWGHWQFDGAEFRALFTVPHADERQFFYGVNLAFVYSESQWHPERYSAEFRPIIGVRFAGFDVIINPIVETSFEGFSKTAIEPAARIAYSLSSRWQTGIEFYSDVGSFGGLEQSRDRSEQLFGVVDYSGRFASIEAGLGFGLTSASDDLVLKLIVSRDLN